MADDKKTSTGSASSAPASKSSKGDDLVNAKARAAISTAVLADAGGGAESPNGVPVTRVPLDGAFRAPADTVTALVKDRYAERL